jgi:hypothetical protein
VELIADALGRLQAASLVPPVKSIEQVGCGNSVRTVISVPGPIGADLENRIAEAMGSLRYELREVPSGAAEDDAEYGQ